MDNECDLFCQIHKMKIEFLNLNKGVKKGERALCKKCKLFDPTEIEEALQIWSRYKDNDMRFFQQEINIILEPLLNLEKYYQEILKTIQESLSVALEVFRQKIRYIKQQSQIECEKMINLNSLSQLQNVAEILGEQKKVYISDGLRESQEQLQKFHIIGKLFFPIAYNLKLCAQLFQNSNVMLCNLITDKYKKSITFDGTCQFQEFWNKIRQSDKNWKGDLILHIKTGKLLTQENEEIMTQLSDNFDICPINDDRLLFMKRIMDVGQIDMQKLESSLGLESDLTLKRQLNILKGETKPSDIPPHLFVAINLLNSELQKQLNQDLRVWNYQKHEIFLKAFYDSLPYCQYYYGKAYRGLLNSQDKYEPGQIVQWNEVITLTKDYKVAEQFARNKGIIFEIDVVSSRDISKFSPYPLIVLFPYSSFLVLQVYQQQNKPAYVKLKEIQSPKSNKIILLVDSQLQNNQKYAQQIEQKTQDQQFLFYNSIEQTIELLNQYYWILYLDVFHFRIILNLKNSIISISSANKLLDYLFNKNYQNYVYIYCDKVPEDLIKQNYKITFISNEAQFIRSLTLS